MKRITTDTIKALYKKKFTSTIMREGLYHKAGSILCITLGLLTGRATEYFNLGVTVPVEPAICTYIVLMEIGSIIENIGEINPAIIHTRIKKHFSKLQELEREVKTNEN